MTSRTTWKASLSIAGVAGLYCLSYLPIRMTHLLVHRTTFAGDGHGLACVYTHSVVMARRWRGGPEDPSQFCYYFFTPLRFLETEAWCMIRPEGTAIHSRDGGIIYGGRGG